MNSHRAKRILIVDDEEEIRTLVRETLMVDEFQIFEAENGDTAMNVIKHEKPDLVLLDVLMPGELNGFEVCRRIKQNAKTRKTGVMLVTAVSMPELTKAETQAEAVFIKPFSPIQLVDSIYDFFGSA
jgi:two-component system phosphate regulon response regulator PhoB